MMCMGLSLKHKWRFVSGRFHLFTKRDPRGGYVSACGRHHISKSGGQKCNRPPAQLRCGYCDGYEITAYGADESLPESKEWQK